MRVADLGVTNIIIEWDEVDCEERNGVITGYSVRYGLSSDITRQNYSTNDTESRMSTIVELMIRTNYSFEVAAINGDGIGVYSSAVTGTTAVPTGNYTPNYYKNSLIYLIGWCRSRFLSEWKIVSQQQHS